MAESEQMPPGAMQCNAIHNPSWAVPTMRSGYAGAYGCTISGAGPTCVAVTDDPQKGERIAEAMVQAFVTSGKLAVNTARVVRLDQTGARTT